MDDKQSNQFSPSTQGAQGNQKHTNAQLYYDQKQLLDTFLEHGAITKAQHDYSLGCLTKKMHMDGADDACPNGADAQSNGDSINKSNA